MFIDGHVSSWTADGVFYNLKSLKPGDSIQVVRGDGKTFTYTVKLVQAYNANNVNMTQALTSIDPSKPGLNLMTCTGNVIKGTSEFNQRLVVYSVLSS
jgi:LPXTG-site transpeptidase (sortase) family protein